MTYDLPIALGRKVGNEPYWGMVATPIIAIVAAIIARFSMSMVAFLGVPGWGLH